MAVVLAQWTSVPTSWSSHLLWPCASPRAVSVSACIKFLCCTSPGFWKVWVALWCVRLDLHSCCTVYAVCIITSSKFSTMVQGRMRERERDMRPLLLYFWKRRAGRFQECSMREFRASALYVFDRNLARLDPRQQRSNTISSGLGQSYALEMLTLLCNDCIGHPVWWIAQLLVLLMYVCQWGAMYWNFSVHCQQQQSLKTIDYWCHASLSQVIHFPGHVHNIYVLCVSHTLHLLLKVRSGDKLWPSSLFVAVREGGWLSLQTCYQGPMTSIFHLSFALQMENSGSVSFLPIFFRILPLSSRVGIKKT